MPKDCVLNVLETERLLLRPFMAADRPLILAIASDPATTKYLYYWGHIGSTPESDADRFLQYALSSWQEKPIRAREFCIVRKADGVAVGDGSIEWVDDATAEIGWILLPAYRGKGYATEMGKALVRAGFEVLGAQKIIAHCDERNLPSRHVMERLGMTLEHIEPEARPIKALGEKKGNECTYVLSPAP